MLDPLLQDLRYALRALRSTPGFAAVAILSLALGIGANTAIFSLIDSVMLKTLPVLHPEELVQLTNLTNQSEFTNPMWEQIRDRQDIFSGICAFSAHRYNLAVGGEARYVEGSRVSGRFFETLGVHTVLGRELNASDDKPGCAGTAVLSYDFWQRVYGGRKDILTQRITLDGHPFSIVGVVQPGFFGVEVGKAVDVMTPVCTEAIIDPVSNSLDRRGDWWIDIVARPKTGISLAQAAARLDILTPQILNATIPPNARPDVVSKYLANKFQVEPAANGLSRLRLAYREALLVLMAVVGVVLLIACANVANLLLARGAARQKEIAIRMALGSGRARLIRQLLTESLLLSFLGAALGVLFAQWGDHLLVSLLSNSRNYVTLDLSMDARMMAFTAAVAILTGLLFGVAPAWRETATNLNARGVVEGSRFGLGKALVTVQVALSFVLVAGAGLMLSTFWKLTSMDLGFNRQNVTLVRVNLPKRRAGVWQQTLERIRAIPGVRSASISGITPIAGNSWQATVEVGSQHIDNIYINPVSPGYFETMGTPFVAGRDFNEHDTMESPLVAIVNEAFAKRFGGLGTTYRTMTGTTLDPPIEIVGIVKDAKYRSLRQPVPPTTYTPDNQEKTRLFSNFEVRSDIEVVSAIKAAIDKDASLQFTTMSKQVDESLTRERMLATLSGFFGALALLLATIGLYGVISYNVARRRNEIGIRMALGAQQSRVLRMVLGEVAVLIFCGLAVGLAVTLGTTRFVSSFLYGLKPNDPITIGAAGAVLAIVAVIAGYLPARRASRLDPMTALREE
jgi:putative ABC transport system permease protein